jgi:hypothetical protein
MEHKQTPNPQFSKAHPTNVNVSLFKMIEAMVLKIFHRGPSEWHHLRTKFHENLPSGTKLLAGERQPREN